MSLISEAHSEGVSGRILVVDDDVELTELLAEYLAPRGFDVDAVHTGGEALSSIRSDAYAMVILDIMLPGMDGLEVLRQIRRESAIPVIMLTARGDDVDRIVGLELGADDYLPKPFHTRELAARIKAILRRMQPGSRQRQIHEDTWVRVGDVSLNAGNREVLRDGRRVELTGIEFELLSMLINSAGQVVERASLFRVVLDREPDPFDRSIDIHVSHLRKKLGREHGGVERIKSIRGVGYIYTTPEG